MSELCPLCGAGQLADFHCGGRRRYLRCGQCALVSVPPEDRLDREAERREYELHENDEADPGYRRFLTRLADPLRLRLREPASGLDFGCGPAPALARMLEEDGHRVALYDSFFFPDKRALDDSYDFITATEVVEHLHSPGAVLRDLWHRLRPGAYLGIMTKLVTDREAFATWHYIRDPTHVCFFSRDTWRWWADRYRTTPEFMGSDVVLFRKEGSFKGQGAIEARR